MSKSDACSMAEVAARMMGMADAEHARDQSDLFKNHDATFQKNYFKGVLMAEGRVYNRKGKITDPVANFFKRDIQNWSSVIDSRITDQMLKGEERWHAAVERTKAWDDMAKKEEYWKLYISPLAKSQRLMLDESDLTPLTINTKKYLTDIERMTPLVGLRRDQGSLGAIADNVTSKVFADNPGIMLANILEYNRTIAETGHHAAIGAIKAVEKTGGQFWKQIPELRAKGVYGQGHNQLTGFVQLTDNWLRAASYYAGEAKGGHAEGMRMVRRGAFAYHLTDMPVYSHDVESKTLLAAMRYGIEWYKWAGSLGADLLKGGKPAVNAGSTIVAYMALNATLGGTKTLLPEFLWPILNGQAPELVKQLEELDKKGPLNLLGRTPLDVSRYMQPGSIVLGVGSEMVNQRIETFNKHLLKAQAKANKGDATAIMDMAKGLYSLSAMRNERWLGHILGQKAFDVAQELIEQDINWEDVPVRYLERLRVIKPVTSKGKEDQKHAMKFNRWRA
jgi:hypothetical protein